jgi:hypothetical protein
MAQAIARGLDTAITYGQNRANWELVRRAHDALFATMAKRAAVVAQLDELRRYRQRWNKYKGRHPNSVDTPGQGVDFRASKTKAILDALDGRFGLLSAADLLRLLENSRLRGLGLATKLSLICGAFEDVRRPHESERVAFRRVKRNYEKAATEVPT